MLSRKNVRVAQRKSLRKVDFAHTKIKWEMSQLRHALFNVVDNCPRLTDVKFNYLRPYHTTVCHLFVGQTMIDISDNQSGVLKVRRGELKKTCSYDNLVQTVKELQPKLVVKIKRPVKK